MILKRTLTLGGATLLGLLAFAGQEVSANTASAGISDAVALEWASAVLDCVFSVVRQLGFHRK